MLVKCCGWVSVFFIASVSYGAASSENKGFQVILDRIINPERKWLMDRVIGGGGTHHLVHVSCIPEMARPISCLVEAGTELEDVYLPIPVLPTSLLEAYRIHKRLTIDEVNQIKGAITISVGQFRYILCRTSSVSRTIALFRENRDRNKAIISFIKQKLTIPKLPKHVVATSVLINLTIEHGGVFILSHVKQARASEPAPDPYNPSYALSQPYPIAGTSASTPVLPIASSLPYVSLLTRYGSAPSAPVGIPFPS